MVAVERAPITFQWSSGKGTLTIGDAIAAELEPFQGATGKSTTLHDTIFTTIPGSPAYVGKADNYKVDVPEHGFEIELQGHNAVQGSLPLRGLNAMWPRLDDRRPFLVVATALVALMLAQPLVVWDGRRTGGSSATRSSDTVGGHRGRLRDPRSCSSSRVGR